jgi:hypothetical protein
LVGAGFPLYTQPYLWEGKGASLILSLFHSAHPPTTRIYRFLTEILHALPVELVRIIFEDAACHSRANAVNLVCVSKTVQKWIVPLLYQTVVLETTRSVLSFYDTILIAKSDFACYIRVLYLPSSPSPGVLPAFLNNFPTLQHLAICSLTLREPPHSVVLHNLPHPISITLTGPLGRISLRHPIFQRCTHLYLADDVPGPLTLTTEVLPCLTHLACAYRHGTSSITGVTCLPLLLAQRRTDRSQPIVPDGEPAATLPVRMTPVKLKVLIVELYLSNGTPDVTMFVMERLGLSKSPLERQLRADPRLVIRPGRPLTPQRWVDGVVNNVMWTTAEGEVMLQT